jgi:hypothetical protein
MIYLLSGNYEEARKWASSQNLDGEEWFATLDVDELMQRSNFHIIVLPGAQFLSPPFFERLWNTAQKRGRVGRL